MEIIYIHSKTIKSPGVINGEISDWYTNKNEKLSGMVLVELRRPIPVIFFKGKY